MKMTNKFYRRIVTSDHMTETVQPIIITNAESLTAPVVVCIPARGDSAQQSLSMSIDEAERLAQSLQNAVARLRKSVA
jgi:hypothetical protein